MVDAMAASAEDYLIDSVSFKLPNTASYVIDRRSVSYWTAGANEYASGTGSKVARINITGDGWLDPSTVRLSYTLENMDGTVNHNLRPLTGPWGFFRRARCMVGGAIVDDIDYYNRVHEMLHILTSKGNRDNDDVEGFSERWDSDRVYFETDKYLVGIPPNGSRAVSFKPLFGIMNQPKYIPLSWCPLTLEFEIASLATDPVVAGGGVGKYDDNVSTSWKIKDIRIICDVVTLDSGLQNSYAEHVLSGKSLPINYGTYISQFQSLGTDASNFSVTITRAVTRLKSMFVNFDRLHGTTNMNDGMRTNVNSFVHPMYMQDYSLGAYNFNKELQWQVQIGSKLFPEYPCTSLAQTFYQLKKALGIHGSAYHNIAITAAQYRNDHFIIGIDTEKILEAGFTGLNSRAGDLMVVKGKAANGGDLNHSATIPWANSIYIILHTDQILEIRDTGVQVFD
jgi:hypothetical protein